MKKPKTKTRRGKSRGRRKFLQLTLLLALLVVLGWGLAMLPSARDDAESSASASPVLPVTLGYARLDLADVPALARTFLSYNRSISLSPAQERIQQEALGALRAPCCDDRSAYTCCCSCNLARSVWGLSKHLIASEGRGAGEVRAAVEGWFRSVNPDGFSGDACYTGGCGRPFRRNGCGGMSASNLVL
jgi:hypothetical protein